MRPKDYHNFEQLASNIRYAPKPKTRLPLWPAFLLIGLAGIGTALVVWTIANY